VIGGHRSGSDLINAAGVGGGWLMFARIAVMRALNAEDSSLLFQ